MVNEMMPIFINDVFLEDYQECGDTLSDIAYDRFRGEPV